jgi:hypothetical protein
MNFTKKYIKECDCEEIQGLRKVSLEYGDWYCMLDYSGTWVGRKYRTTEDLMWINRNEYTWLPTGDQLDEEIIKIIKDNRDYSHNDEERNYWTLHTINNSNPLIAKIKLLKQLLEEK